MKVLASSALMRHSSAWPRSTTSDCRQGKGSPAAINVDVAPTLLALGGVKAPASMDGRSLLPALAANAAQVRDELLIEYYSDTEFPRVKGMGYKAVRTSRYKYIRYDELRGMDEVYDLVKDPHELDNLYPDRVPAGVMADLTARLGRLLSAR
jgi:arylsulfatase A-like enzyme